MKLIVSLLLTCAVVLSVSGQGTVNWTTPSTAITTNDFAGHSGPIAGVNAYRFGLYIGPVGAAEESLTLVAITTNNPSIPGTFRSDSSGINLPFPVGTTIEFQVRGWSLFAGSSYESALGYALGGGSPTAFLGKSALGSYVEGSGLDIQSSSFVLTPVPEPAPIVFGIAGAALILLQRRRRPR